MRGLGAWLLLLGPALAAAQEAARPASSADEAADARREAAIARCEAQRGVDCRTEKGLRVWILQERTREEAVEDGSRSIRQRVDRLEDRTPR